MINAYVLIIEDLTYLYDAIRHLNQIIDDENRVLKARRTRTAKKKENETETPPMDLNEGEEEDIIS